MSCATCGATLAPGTAFCPNCGAGQPVQAATPAAAAAQAPGYMTPVAAPAYPAVFSAGYATWGSRAIGFLIDSLLVGGVMAVLYFLLAGLLTSVVGFADNHAAGGICCMFLVLFPVATLVVGIYNGVYLIAQRGASIGQAIVKLRVVDANGNLLTQGSAFIRLLVRAAMGFIPFLPVIDLLWPLWDTRGQTLHDKAVNCYVVNYPQGY